MKTIHKIPCLFLLLAFALQAFAAPEAEYGKLSKTYILKEDGSREFRCQMELTLFTHTAMNGTYGESFIVYDPAYQELKIHTSYTRQKDGTIITRPENAFVEVLPAQAADAPAYNRLREMVVVHTGLELGATIYLDYSILTKPGYLPELDICEPIEQTSPVKDYTIRIEAPADKPLFYTLLNSSARPVVSKANGNKVVWNIRNLPAASREPQASALGGDVQWLVASTYPSAGEALKVLSKQLTPKGDMPLLSLSESLTEGLTSDTEKLQAILRHLVDHIGYSRLSLQETGFRLRPSDEVIPSAYGTEAEKVNLLAGLLDAAGIRCEIIASYPKNIEINTCGLSAILELFVSAQADGKTYLLTPKGKVMSDAGRQTAYKQYLSLSNPGKELSLEPPSFAIDYQYVLSVSAGKADIQAKGSLGEAFIPYTETKKEKELTDNTSQLLRSHEGYCVLSLPEATAGLAHAPYSRYNSRRSANLLLPYAAKERYSYTIHLAEGMELSTPVYTKTIDNPVGKVFISLKQNGESIELIRELEINKQWISPADYPAFRRLMVEWAERNNRQLLVRTSE
ncbi:MAG: DUF3858 domain-containing protein [Tannerellaceae bacterium]|jgi:hypothetical protein|nr:DUF3858 domain-containing protein [Tannerellaceae bacterium]